MSPLSGSVSAIHVSFARTFTRDRATARYLKSSFSLYLSGDYRVVRQNARSYSPSNFIRSDQCRLLGGNMRTTPLSSLRAALPSTSHLAISIGFVCAGERAGSNRDNRRVAETLSIVRANFAGYGRARKQCSDNSDKVAACPRICIAPLRARGRASGRHTDTSTTGGATAKGQIGTCVIGQVTKLNGS